MKKEKKNALDLIRSNISSHGYHIYAISGGPLPRFFYTIGLIESIGFELIMAGSYFYSANEAKQILDKIMNEINSHPTRINSKIKTNSLGSFKLRKADNSWTNKLMLGALDFYNSKEISALQIIPDLDHWTIDTPDLSESWSIQNAPIWRWLGEPWSYQSISDHSVAVTNLSALRGEKVTEATRWEEDQWELFAGSGPDTPPAEIRVVPIGVLLDFDPSLKKVVSLDVGHALWRDKLETEWHVWG
ncbi:DUF4262 domain-containing protein [Pseudomonas protegens]|uniref:DUF4262 domain-containing protein n=1 Tax=Pseudomonas protegens TaxID=380021 RepID=UPI0016164824|nr:DUF4262 domain-containing protein [Pseudomonas protegens]